MTQGLRWITWFLGIALTTGTGVADDLDADLAKMVGRNPDIGVQVIDCATGAVLFTHNAGKRFTPASNLKVFTTAAALDLAGTNYEFSTELLALTEGTKTTLTLVGSGDPALFDQELILPNNAHGNWTTVAAACDAWAASLRHAGLEKIDEFVLDARIFDTEPIPSGDKKWITNRTAGTYATGVWGFNLAGNAATLSFNWAPGARPRIANSEPPIAWRVVSNTASCAGKANDFGVGYGKNIGELTMSGSLPRATDTAPVAILDPLPLAAEMFARELGRRGIAIAQHRVAVQADRQPRGSVVQPVLTTPLATVLYGANTHSKNICADALVKLLGSCWLNPNRPPIDPHFKPGTFAAGEAALKDFVDRRLGTGCAGVLCARDGSGLSSDNKVTADLTARLIAVMAQDPKLGAAYRASFARPGREGTLKKRFQSTNLFGAEVLGKSGYIEGVCCLSGIVEGEGGVRVSYSILCNNAEPQSAKQRQEEIVARIARGIGPERTQSAAAGDRH
jgi:D-alanyl-D-alanine carboxypeptidase/D-alanyl-D-alanine-endopeptidase (penicillin-binding protein 4)